jgi:hypothetical protein
MVIGDHSLAQVCVGSLLGALLGLTAWIAVNPAVVQYITQSRIGRVMKLQDNYTLRLPPAANIDEDRQESDGNVRLV